MSSRRKKILNHHGKASKPNLAVFVLLVIVIIQAFFLFKAYGPKTKKTYKKPVATAPAPVAPLKPTTQKPPEVALPVPESLPQGNGAKIIIIVDDSGYKKNDCAHLADINVPVTISILPELPHSRETAECAFAQGKEVMLHMPLEPHVFHEKYEDHYFIKTDMSSSQISSRFNEALKSVPHVSGINNHEGSKATEDSRVMYIIFKELAKRGLFFLDSRVTNKSICKKLAEKMGLPFAGRDVFLDNTNERSYIEGQYRVLAKKASENGYAVAIGHARELSWVVLKDQIKKLQAQGFEFITVGQLISETK